VKRLAVVVTAVLALAGCGEKEEVTTPSGATERLDLVLDYTPNPDHAGIYAAIADGQFERAGLDVKPVVPPDPSAPLRLLQAGRADVAISYEPELLLARDKGADLVAIGALVQQPLTSIMSLGKNAVRDVAELKGKTVGTAGISYQDAYLTTVLREAGVEPGSVKRVNVGFGLIPAMTSKRVDATLGAFWNVEGVQLEREKKEPHIIRIEQAGVPTYDELILVARAQDLRERGPLYRSFLQALARGHRLVRRDPEAGVDALLEADNKLDRGDTLASVRATLPAFFPDDEDQPFGFMDKDEWARYAQWMLDNELLKQRAEVRALTNEFLPGEGI
jgi:putative hydroxymethylpyrimidine transport system substrate-binding protein